MLRSSPMFQNELDRYRPLAGLHPGNLASRVRLSPGETQGVIKGESGGTQPESIEFTFSIQPNDPYHIPSTTSNLVVFARAKIMWGVGGIRMSADVDITQGATVSVVAESYEVRVTYHVECPPWVTEEEREEQCRCACLPDLWIGASVGYGSSFGARFTEAAFVLHPEESTLIPIPPFAASFTVLPLQDSLVTAHLRGQGLLYDVRDVIVAPLSNLGQSNRIDQIPIPNGAIWVEIESRQETDIPANALVVFAIGLR